MQIVDVLGDDRGNLAGFIKRGERAVASPWPRGGECRFHCEAPPPCLVAGIRACNKFVEWNWTVAGPQSAGRAEIWNPAFGRDAGACEGNDSGCLRDHIAEPFRAAAKIRCDHGVIQMFDRADYSTANRIASRMP